MPLSTVTPPIRTKVRRKRVRRRAERWYIIFLFVMALGILGASLAIGVFLGFIGTLPPIEELEEYNPNQATIVLDRGGSHTIGEFAEERRHVMAAKDIPDNVKLAVLAIEDDRFYDHYGVDVKSVVRSMVVNFKAGSFKEGFSTITMQLPRNIIPEKVSRDKTVVRKIKESLMAFQIERRYSKEQILAFYLNHIDMGRQSFGIYAAALTYFNKEPKDLTLAECASLAAIPKGPSIYNPLGNPKSNRERRDYILKRMNDLKWINEAEYERAVNTPLVTVPGKRRSNVANSEHPYFVDALHRDLTNTYSIPGDDLDSKGWVINSTVDPRIQKIVEEELPRGLAVAEVKWQEKKPARFYVEAEDMPGNPKPGQTRLMKIDDVISTHTVQVSFGGYRGTVQYKDELPYYNPALVIRKGAYLDVRVDELDSKTMTMKVRPGDTSKIQGSIVILDSRSGEVLAVTGGNNFFDSGSDGMFNRAVMGGRQAGSTVKPFFYAEALERGWGPHDMIMDQEITIPSVPKDYKPQNYEKRFFGPTTIIEALEHSRNVTTVRLFMKLGVKRTLEDIVTYDYRPGDNSWRTKFPREVSVCLGTVDLSAMDLAASYLVYTNQGVGRSPSFFRSITDRNGREVALPKTNDAIVLDPVTAYQMVYILRQVVLDGTGKLPIGDKFPSPPYPPLGGKTGTTDASTDAWFIGMSPDLVICVYVGFDTPRSLGPKMTGGQIAGPIWANVFARTFATRDQWAMEYDAPSGIERADICKNTGKRASHVCTSSRHKIYKGVPYRRGQAPYEPCDGAVRSMRIGSAYSASAAAESESTPSVEGVF